MLTHGCSAVARRLPGSPLLLFCGTHSLFSTIHTHNTVTRDNATDYVRARTINRDNHSRTTLGTPEIMDDHFPP